MVIKPRSPVLLIGAAVVMQDQKVDVKEGLFRFDGRDLTVDEFPDKLQGDHVNHLLLRRKTLRAYRFNSPET